MAKKGSFQSCGTNAKNRERARQAHFACSSSQSESMIRFILPACGFSHIIIENNIKFFYLGIHRTRFAFSWCVCSVIVVPCDGSFCVAKGRNNNNNKKRQINAWITNLSTPLSCKKQDAQHSNHFELTDQRIVHSQGASNINYSNININFDVCRLS